MIYRHSVIIVPKINEVWATHGGSSFSTSFLTLWGFWNAKCWPQNEDNSKDFQIDQGGKVRSAGEFLDVNNKNQVDDFMEFCELEIRKMTNVDE